MFFCHSHHLRHLLAIQFVKIISVNHVVVVKTMAIKSVVGATLAIK